MPDPKNKQAQNADPLASQDNEGSDNQGSELDQLRQELGVFKAKYESTQTELEDFRNRYDEREEQYQRDYGRQGQELGERIKQLQELVGRVIQPADDEPKSRKKRPLAVQIPDNVTAQDEFLKFQQGLVEQVYGLQDELTELRNAGGQSQSLQAEIKKLQDELNLMRYENYVAKEESTLRGDYGLDDRDLRDVQKYAKESGIYSLEAAAIKVPRIKEKMFSNYAKKSGQTNGHDLQDDDRDGEPPKKKSRYNAKQIGDEMLKTKPDETIPRGGAKRIEENLDWVNEMKAAVKDGSYFRWPQAKIDEYEDRLRQQQNEMFAG